MKTILLDCDGVLADCATPVHAAAQRILRRDLPGPSLWHDFDFGTSMGLSAEENDLFYRRVLKEDCLGWQICPYPGASEFVSALQDADFDVCIVTAQWVGMHCWVPARTELVRECFPDVDVVFAHAKHRVQGDLLVDDKPATLYGGNRERGVLFHQPWNASTIDLRRVRNYAELLELCAAPPSRTYEEVMESLTK